MKKIIAPSLLIILLLLACKNIPTTNHLKEEVTNENLVGADLFFSWLRIGSFYNKSDAKDINIDAALDVLAKNNTDSDSSLIVLYKKLNERDLLFSPYIDVKLEDGTQNTWYINQADYDSIKTFKIEDLRATNTKVHLSAEVEHIYQNAFYIKKIEEIKIEEAFGYQNSDKISAGNYK